MNDTMSPEALQQYWRNHVTAWENLGLSGQGYCNEHQLTYHRFVYWRQKYRENVDSRPASKKNSGFTAVVRSNASAKSGLTVVLPNGIELQGVTRDNIEVVSALVKQL